MSAFVGLGVSAPTSSAQRQANLQAGSFRLPSTNRAVEITGSPDGFTEVLLEFAVHELTGTTRCTVDEVLGTLSEFGVSVEEQQYGSRMYRRRWVGEFGVTVQTENKMGSDEVHVRLPGQSCEHLGLVQLLSLGTLLNLKVTRLDAAIDYCPFTPRHLLMAQESGLVRTHAQAYHWHVNADGDTFELGSRTSDVFLRCYDRRGYTRTELELKRGHAQKFLAEMMARDVSEFPALFLGALRSHVDFVDVGACENISRAPLLPFWRSFVGMFERVKLAPARAVPVVDKYLRQVRKYAAMFHVYGVLAARAGVPLVSALTELWTHGSGHLKTRHRLMLGCT